MHQRNGTIRFHLDVKAGGRGTAYRVGPDGRRVPVGPPGYARVTPETVVNGAVLYNPVTRETHGVQAVNPLVVETTDGPREISWADAHATLLVVL